MTVIAYRDGIMAADTAGFMGDGRYHGICAKIFRLQSGWLTTGSGDYQELLFAVRWIEKHGLDRLERPLAKSLDGGLCLLIVKPDGEVVCLNSHLVPMAIEAPFHALGSGGTLAIGAMAAGASAIEAVKIACEFDGSCRLPIQVESINGEAI